jgi:hypothetical protein
MRAASLGETKSANTPDLAKIMAYQLHNFLLFFRELEQVEVE